MTLHAIFICTANRFRSPLAAALFELAARPVSVAADSAGTTGPPRRPPLPEAVAEAARFGIDLAPHRSRRISADGLRDADLVVGFERAHVAAAVVEAGAPRGRTFTLLELVDLLRDNGAGDTLARARQAIAHADAHRAARGRFGGAEIPDPVGRSAAAQRRIATDVRELVYELAARLFATPR